tara:strand:+ start:738 stop:974 length:237 start_codon:yes stop_codon:yes gene_type:complete
MELVEITDPPIKASINPEAVYTMDEVRDYLDISKPTLVEMVKDGILHAPTVNGKAKGKRFVTGENLRRFALGLSQVRE